MSSPPIKLPNETKYYKTLRNQPSYSLRYIRAVATVHSKLTVHASHGSIAYSSLFKYGWLHHTERLKTQLKVEKIQSAGDSCIFVIAGQAKSASVTYPYSELLASDVLPEDILGILNSPLPGRPAILHFYAVLPNPNMDEEKFISAELASPSATRTLGFPLSPIVTRISEDDIRRTAYLFSGHSVLDVKILRGRHDKDCNSVRIRFSTLQGAYSFMLNMRDDEAFKKSFGGLLDPSSSVSYFQDAAEKVENHIDISDNLVKAINSHSLMVVPPLPLPASNLPQPRPKLPPALAACGFDAEDANKSAIQEGKKELGGDDALINRPPSQAMQAQPPFPPVSQPPSNASMDPRGRMRPSMTEQSGAAMLGALNKLGLGNKVGSPSSSSATRSPAKPTTNASTMTSAGKTSASPSTATSKPPAPITPTRAAASSVISGLDYAPSRPASALPAASPDPTNMTSSSPPGTLVPQLPNASSGTPMGLINNRHGGVVMGGEAAPDEAEKIGAPPAKKRKLE